jgi:outer membrane protein assembly factor BamB
VPLVLEASANGGTPAAAEGSSRSRRYPGLRIAPLVTRCHKVLSPTARLTLRSSSALLTLALATALAACSGDDESAQPQPTEPRPAPTTTEAPEPEAPPTLVRVVDGDTGRHVPGAVVRAGSSQARSNARGRAALQLGERRRAVFHVRAPGYSPERLRARAHGKPVVVRIYRPAFQWTMYGANLARTQAHPAIRLRPPFRVAWRRKVGALMEFPAVVWQGVAYVSNIRGYVTAISLDRGKVVWKRRIGTLMAASPAVVPERNELVVPTMSPGELVVLNVRTGRRKWMYPTGRAEPSPAIRGGIAYFGAANGNVYAMNLERRRPRWVYRGGVKVTSSAAVVGNRVYFGDYAGRVVCLNARTGRRIWVGSAGSRVYGTVAVAGGRVFAPSVFSGLSALSARTGRLLWRNPVSGYLYSSPAYYRGRVYYGTYGWRVYSVSARTGRIHWSRSTGRAVSGAVQVVAGVVYAADFSKETNGWHWRTGRHLFRFGRGKYVPISGNAGRLLLHGTKTLYALEPRKRRA